MIPLDYRDREFQELIRRELNLPKEAELESCRLFEGTEIGKHCIGIVQARGITNILIKGTFEITGDAVVLYLDFPGAPDMTLARKELDGAGLAPDKARFVGICTRLPARKGKAAEGPEIQVVLIPY